MEVLNFIKKCWNLVLGASLAIVVIVGEFIVRPQISFSFAEGEVDYGTLSKFVVAAIILILLVPCTRFKTKKFLWLWWSLALVVFAVAITLFFVYNKTVNRKSAYNRFTEERTIIGQSLTPLADSAVNIAKLRDGIVLSPSDML